MWCVCSAVMDKGERKNRIRKQKQFFSLEFLHHLCQYLFIGCPIDFNFRVACKRPNTKFLTKQNQQQKETHRDTHPALGVLWQHTNISGLVLHCTFSYLTYTFFYTHLFVTRFFFFSIRPFHVGVIEKINKTAEKMKINFHHVSVFFIAQKQEFIRLKVCRPGGQSFSMWIVCTMPWAQEYWGY